MEHNIFFSAKNRAFYNESLKELYDAGGTWPDDAVSITEREYQKYRAPAPEGKQLSSGANGKPKWESRQVTQEEKIERASSLVKNALAKYPLYKLPIDLGIATKEEESAHKEFAEYIVNLNRHKASLEAGEDSKEPSSPKGA